MSGKRNRRLLAEPPAPQLRTREDLLQLAMAAEAAGAGAAGADVARRVARRTGLAAPRTRAGVARDRGAARRRRRGAAARRAATVPAAVMVPAGIGAGAGASSGARAGSTVVPTAA